MRTCHQSNPLCLCLYLAIATLLLPISNTFADISAHACPWSCTKAGIHPANCRQWRTGDTCYVEDVSQRTPVKPSRKPRIEIDEIPDRGIRLGGSQAGYEHPKRGFVTYRTCPYSCQSAGINHSFCRDWRTGNDCYVEDLRQAQGGPIRIDSPSSPATPPPIVNLPRPGSNIPSTSQSCRNLTGRYIAAPRISIDVVERSGSFFGEKYTVKGTIEGVCIVDAGVFEQGRKRGAIRIDTIPEFQRYPFKAYVYAKDDPEVRAYNVNGDVDQIELFDSQGYPYDRRGIR